MGCLKIDLGCYRYLTDDWLWLNDQLRHSRLVLYVHIRDFPAADIVARGDMQNAPLTYVAIGSLLIAFDHAIDRNKYKL